MDFVSIFFAAAVAWFFYWPYAISVYMYRFVTFPRTFGRKTNISLNDLSELAELKGQDVPSFNVIIPAYQETLVIDGTLRRMAAMNYPRALVNIWVVTYEDEPREPELQTTNETARLVGSEINAQAGRDLIRTLTVPAGFDGEFPGRMDSDTRYVGKPRGLNFALRRIHERNERDERRLYTGKMLRLGHAQEADRVLEEAEAAVRLPDPGSFLRILSKRFDTSSADYLGPCTFSTDLRRAALLYNEALGLFSDDADALAPLRAFIETEAPRFFLELENGAEADGVAPEIKLSVMASRDFLYDVMQQVEGQDAKTLAAASEEIEARLAQDRPRLHAALSNVHKGADLFQMVRRVNSRWVAVYDADADAPVDLLRHLAARILTEPDVIGFQGPVSPVANYTDVHPLCKLGGLWMGFWHSTGYPRLFCRQGWAHVLAGTNWCFRMEGMKKDNRLVRTEPYEETKREFILSFDPRQLTEDLEIAVRVFDKWHVNAEWHPYVEVEQVPARPREMILQRRRWTLGTLQTVSYMLRSRLPLGQKLKYGFLPLNIIFSGAGPIVTIALWVLIYTGELISSPLLIAWSIFLTVGNVTYVLPHLLSHERFVMTLRRDSGTRFLLRRWRALSDKVSQRCTAGKVSTAEAALLQEISTLLNEGASKTGFLERYKSEHCLDYPAESEEAARLLADTPTALLSQAITEPVSVFSRLNERSHNSVDDNQLVDKTLKAELKEMKSALQKAGGSGRWRSLRRRERGQIWLWALVYLFWQLVPSYIALANWITGRAAKNWVKTPRTRKTEGVSSN